MRDRRRLLAALAASAALAGCGGDSAGEHRRNADTVCGEVRAQIDALGEPRTMEDLERVAHETLPIARAGVRRLSALDGATEESKAFVAELSRQLPLIVELGEAAAFRNTGRVEKLGREGRAREARAAQLAKAAGFEICGTAPAVPGA